MRAIVVDDELLALKKTTAQVESLGRFEEVLGFSSPFAALHWLEQGEADVAFLDVEMHDMNGIELAKACKDLRPRICLIFITAYSEYAVDAFRVRASGYLLKPVSTEELLSEVEHLELPREIARTKGDIYIQTFGNFEIFVHGVPVMFRRAKAKELLAYLVDRKGSGVSMAEIAATLWEERPYDRGLQNQVQMVVSEMMRALKSVGAEQILVKKRNFLSVIPERIDCDYYRFLKGDADAINCFMGEYMSNYSWAELTAGLLGQRSV